MKKILAVLLALCCLAFAALAEGDYTYYPESEAYVGTWYVDDAILEIEHMPGEQALFRCVVTRYAPDQTSAVRWAYDNCSYDDIGMALSSFEIGVKTELTFDENNEVASETRIYDDGAATFQLLDDGTLVWTDFKEAPREDRLAFQKVPEGEDNPVAAYEGTWVEDRIVLTIEDLDDVITCEVHWGSSASESTQWRYEGCVYDESIGGLTADGIGVKANVVYDENGEIVSSEEVYADGSATFIINGSGQLVWNDLEAPEGMGICMLERSAD